MTITAIIIIHGDPRHAGESLTSIADHIDELIIGDINMTFQIPESIKEKTRVSIIKINHDIAFADLIKEDLKQKASGDFILYLDPDEVMPENLWKLLKQKMIDNDFFSIPRKNIIFDKWIKHSRWWPDYQIRFFRKDKVIWPKNLHPVPKTEGRECRVEPKEELSIIHYNYENISSYLEKSIRYAKFEAKDYFIQKKDLTLSETNRKAISEFISRFYAAEGYKDGMHGFILAFMQMFYYFLVYFFYWEEKKYEKNDFSAEKATNFFKQILIESSYWLSKKNLISYKSKLINKIQNFFLKLK